MSQSINQSLKALGLSKQELLNKFHSSFTTLSEAKTFMDLKTGDQVYSKLIKTYTKHLSDKVKQQEKEKKATTKQNLKNYKDKLINEVKDRYLTKQQKSNKSKNNFEALPSLDIEIPTQKSRNDRINVLDTSSIKSNDLNKERGYWDRQALGGVFQEIILNHTTVEGLQDVLINVIMKEFYTKDKEKTMLCSISISYVMRKVISATEVDDKTLFYHSDFEENMKSAAQVTEWVALQVQQFHTRIEEQVNSSNLTLMRLSQVKIQMSKRNKTRAGSYIELESWIDDKKACVNIKNDDDKCILYCLAANKHFDDLSCRKNLPQSYKKWMSEIVEPVNQSYPINIFKDIPRFEKLNNIKINVFQYSDKKEIEVMYNTKQKNTNICDLLLLTSGDVNHFVLVRDISKLLKTPKQNNEKMYWCRNCLNCAFVSQEKLDEHINICNNNEAIRCVLPDADKNELKFKNHGNSFQHPFSVFLDFESTLENVTDDSSGNKTVKYQKHIANSCGMKYNCIHDEYSESRCIINNPDADVLLEKTILKLEEYAIKSYKLLQQNKTEYKLSNKQQINHNETICCVECKYEFDEENKKVIHHNHITGEFISTLCNKCNLKYKYKKFLPVYIHNLKGYDSHFLVPALNKYGYCEKTDEKITCIPSNEEKYISFSKHIKVDEFQNSKSAWQDHIKKYCKENDIDYKSSVGNKKVLSKCSETYVKGSEVKMSPVMFEIRFLDSLAFLPSSIETLTSNLRSGSTDIKYLRKVFKNTSKQFEVDEEFLLMTEKGIYPYEHISNYDVLKETQLPSIDKFYSKLNASKCSIDDYSKAQKVWKTFECNSLLDYHNLYLTADVLLLADIWENFRAVCYKIYELDVSYYYTSPGLSWDSFLKHTTEEYKEQGKDAFHIELLTDMDMYLLFEKSIRGGLSQISKRYAKANHKELSTYNPNAIDEYILYLDANNLYGGGMSCHLPEKDFKWNNDEWNTDRILALDDFGNTGYLFEVDLHYPKELHDLHNGYALASENINIKNTMLNAWQQEGRKDTSIQKLTTSFFDKIQYGVNYRLLKLFLKQGLIITKFHRVVQYTQSNYMASYINKNTEERKNAKNDFEKDFYKLMNNSVYGKTMENVRNRINFKLVSTAEEALRIRNTKRQFTIFNENLVGVHLLKKEVKLNKPIFIGQNVLDESKWIMYDFHYNFMLKKFEKKNIDLLFTDTDSLCYHIKRQNPFELMKENKELFDLAAYPKDHELYDATNKKVIGKMKNETVDGEVHYIKEFVGLRSKLYSYSTEDAVEHNKCKGVKRSVVKQDILFQNYKNTLFDRQNFTIKQNVFRSYKHQLYTETVSKTALSCNDDKSYILNNNIETLTLGHYRIK